MGPPLQVGVGYTSRNYCDGQGLALPGRWPIENRRYPRSLIWKKVAAKFGEYSRRTWNPMGRVTECPFDAVEVSKVKEGIGSCARKKQRGDREEVPIDFRFLGLLLTADEDPEVE